jgi:hypothetical protein
MYNIPNKVHIHFIILIFNSLPYKEKFYHINYVIFFNISLNICKFQHLSNNYFTM